MRRKLAQHVLFFCQCFFRLKRYGNGGGGEYFAYIVHTEGLDSNVHPGYHMDAFAEAEPGRQQSLKAPS